MMTVMWEAYPGLKSAVLCIAYDGGGVSVIEPESAHLEQAKEALSDVDPDDLAAVDVWLRGLSEAELSTVCVGEETEMREAMQRTGAPPKADEILNTIFDPEAP